jgi:hypothetical protein
LPVLETQKLDISIPVKSNLNDSLKTP